MNRKFIVFISRLFLVVGAFLFLHQFAYSAEIHEFYSGARAMGMGGAHIAVVNDETALLSNPAGLGKLRESYGTIIDPEAEIGNNAYRAYTAQSISDFFSFADVSASLLQNRDLYYHAKGQTFPSFVVRNFGIGIFWKKQLDAIMNTAGTAMTTTYYDDMALILGYNFRFFDGRVKIGFNGKFISRIEVLNKDLDPTGDLTLKTHAKEGAGIGSDVGLVLTAPWKFLPTISAVLRDVGGTTFEAGSGLRLTNTTGDRPTKVLQDYDVAVALFPIHGNRTRSSFTIEYQKVQEASLATDKTRYTHVGYEFNWADLLFFRAGMNQRYWTAGVELASEHTQIQIASYGEDVGPDGTPLEDRRFVFKFAFRF